MSCGKKFLYLKKRTSIGWRYAFLPALCKTWSCEKCRRKKATIVQRFIKEHFSGRPIWMLSITYFHSGDLIDTWKKIGATCNRLLTYAHKHSGGFDYIRIVEPHKDGNWPHIHILCDKPIATERFVKLVTDWGFGWNFHSKPITVDVASSYVGKYLTKKWPDGNADLMRVLSRTRIVSCSRGLGAIFTKEAEWICVDFSADPDRVEFMHSAICTAAKSQGCTFILSKAFSSGFMVETDVELPERFEERFLDPYIWRVSDSYDYIWAPFGLQMEIEL